MFRIILLFIIFYFAYKLFKSFFPKNSEQKESAQQKIKCEKMIPCDTCGVYHLESKSVTINGRHYCSEKCAKKDNFN